MLQKIAVTLLTIVLSINSEELMAGDNSALCEALITP